MNCLLGTLGLVSIVCAPNTPLLTVLQRGDPSWIPLEDSIYTALGLLTILTGISIVLLVGGLLLSKTLFFRRMALFTVQSAHQGYTSRTYPDSLIGLHGTAQTPLRPAGKAVIRGVYYDVRTPGTYIAPGTDVVVTDVVGTSLTVKAIPKV